MNECGGNELFLMNNADDVPSTVGNIMQRNALIGSPTTDCMVNEILVNPSEDTPKSAPVNVSLYNDHLFVVVAGAVAIFPESGDQGRIFTRGKTISVPVGQKYRLINPGEEVAKLLQIVIGPHHSVGYDLFPVAGAGAGSAARPIPQTGPRPPAKPLSKK